ncbi:putative mucin TcMUCII [Trypanosoma cruzi]|uniref:Mucin TcMUCII, putative n=2 Tax=Trypanosoma cruzi TaxID=5693 RepID=Q4DAA8_TRYCC|nr:mucin TcMUCII, putative [Trypanosoma cruzi]EAN89461.1 mucin TcMUCII, putative [Trypanosoma cruzi]PWV20704.1 putative mucin TcMUCII [Trypanosoma cruzi]RNC35615.1 mucin TcMUCII [Trypanosoma cruzi]|eukprot:XP_811312.1 mucin TcMUCII [Trypanosoma cruzi strain CL Brener]
MMTCRLLCALLVLALCCCPSVCVTATGEEPDNDSSNLPRALPQEAGVPEATKTSVTSSLAGMTVTLPGTHNSDDKGQASETRSDTAIGTGGVPDTSGIPVPTVTVGSNVQGAGGPATLENDAEQPHGTSGLQSVADLAKTVQEQAQITGPGGTWSRSTSSKENTGSGSQTSQGLSSGNGTAQNPGEKEAVGSNKPDGKEPNLGTTTDTGKGKGTGSPPSTSPDSTSPEPITEQQPSGSANPVQQVQKANAPTTTTTTQAPSTTTTEAPTTTTTRAPSRLREIDGSLSSSAWVCAPLLLAVSALAYTAVG